METDEPVSPAPDEERPAQEAGRGAAPTIPTPVRAALGGAPHASSEAAIRDAASPPEAPLEVEGVRWTVRVLGRSGAGAARTPLLLLGFFHPDDPGAPRREAWAVARGLGALTQLQLEDAWRAGTTPSSGGERKPFFPEITTRGAKEG